MSGDGSFQYITTGDIIPTDSGVLRGHGTQNDDEKGQLRATVSGFVDRVNKLVSVRPLNSRYGGEVGDVVVCRVIEVADKVWRVDVNSKQMGVLMLSSINLPGGVQRRRTHADALQMRQFFAEHDLISAEVQKLMNDGAISLHTRNDKYGKLTAGHFVSVAPNIVKRCKQHFHTLPFGIDIILGNNGYIWIQGSEKMEGGSPKKQKTEGGGGEGRGEESEVREKIARVRNCVVALSKLHIAIFKETILDVYNDSVQLGLTAKDILKPSVLTQVTQTAMQRTQISIE